MILDLAKEARETALARALCLLDTFAGEGLAHVYGNGQVLDATEVCTQLCGAYGLQCAPGWYRIVALLSAPGDLTKPAGMEPQATLAQASPSAEGPTG